MKAGFRIGIVGPESTGKSALSIELARHYGVNRVPEVARDFLENLNRPYREEDLLHLARLQLNAEQDVLKSGPLVLICDTTLLVIRIWSLFKYGRCHPEIIRMEEERAYDLFLLTDIDIPWEADPLREHPDRRSELFGWYYRALLEKSRPFAVVKGTGMERTLNAIRAIERISGHSS